MDTKIFISATQELKLYSERSLRSSIFCPCAHNFALFSLQQQNLNKAPMSVGPRDLGYRLDDDELDRASKYVFGCDERMLKSEILNQSNYIFN